MTGKRGHAEPDVQRSPGAGSAAHLRRAQPDDVSRMFRWRNLPEIVALASNQRPVTWEEHVTWFHRVTTDPGHLVLVIVSGEDDVGQVRFDPTEPGVAQVSIYLLPRLRGTGLGVEVLRQACTEAFRVLPVDVIEASIRGNNERSMAAFARAGFHPADRAHKAEHQLLALRRGTTATSEGGGLQ